ncbi:globin domain-containing protein [Paenibacillus sp. SYP-B4298]|uniref:globin domain-containing protein n=1 Tax=Paenibacillus sp. SYP-B4298 TaxID=2996034 RepID=UPI0022DD2520|nr:globin [Paenibacillus sp. SYP-B4298]
MTRPNTTIYEALGGEAVIRRLVQAFYPRVQAHPLLGPIFPEDINPVMEKQYMFLTQFFGGPQLYSDAHGHPMMRARHMPFPITEERADAWLSCMGAALLEIGIERELAEYVLERLSGPAYHFINTGSEVE